MGNFRVDRVGWGVDIEGLGSNWMLRFDGWLIRNDGLIKEGKRWVLLR